MPVHRDRQAYSDGHAGQYALSPAPVTTVLIRQYPKGKAGKLSAAAQLAGSRGTPADAGRRTWNAKIIFVCVHMALCGPPYPDPN